MSIERHSSHFSRFFRVFLISSKGFGFREMISRDCHWFKTNDGRLNNEPPILSQMNGNKGCFSFYAFLLMAALSNNRKSLMNARKRSERTNHSLALFTKSSLITLNKYWCGVNILWRVVESQLLKEKRLKRFEMWREICVGKTFFSYQRQQTAIVGAINFSPFVTWSIAWKGNLFAVNFFWEVRGEKFFFFKALLLQTFPNFRQRWLP